MGDTWQIWLNNLYLTVMMAVSTTTASTCYYYYYIIYEHHVCLHEQYAIHNLSVFLCTSCKLLRPSCGSLIIIQQCRMMLNLLGKFSIIWLRLMECSLPQLVGHCVASGKLRSWALLLQRRCGLLRCPDVDRCWLISTHHLYIHKYPLDPQDAQLYTTWS